MSRNRPNEGIDGKFAVPEVDIFSNHDQQHIGYLRKFMGSSLLPLRIGQVS
jgi:hypothetical protein